MSFEVQASTDLKQWSPMTTVTNLTGTLEFTDPRRGEPFAALLPSGVEVTNHAQRWRAPSWVEIDAAEMTR